MRRKLPLLAALALVLSACGGGAPKGAAEAATRLLTAAMNDDQAAFEAEIDRAALRDDVRRQVTAMAKTKALDVEGGPSEFALDRMISPEAIRLVDAQGRRRTEAPAPDEVRRMLKPLGERKVCLRQGGSDCLLTFGKGKDGWRLVGMQARDMTIQVAEARF
ncbi:hypothetical protein [Phenylobacterium kunshanense]|uniref:hypothetical protein n=1 Tax=Phenylobacterium kunshanense TaxID=1445034 RepID=UPI0010576534|nr:hypothetical protein [Phenylobacterium kunshanense]